MGNKTLDLCCLSCDIEFKLKFSMEDVRSKTHVLHCPFCGEEIDIDNEDEEGMDYDESENEG